MSVPNIEKLFQYLSCVSKQPIEFSGVWNKNFKSIPQVKLIGDKITSIQLNSKFFYTDKCEMCGGCDPAESNLFTSSEYDKIQSCSSQDFLEEGLDPKYLSKLKIGLYKKGFYINGKISYVWIYDQELNELYLPTREKILSRCTWCYQESSHVFKCRIHPVESITCIMPHLRIFHFGGSSKSSIGLAQFGRNWALKCPVELLPPDTEEQFNINKNNRIEKLLQLNQVGIDLNIVTYLPEVIEYVERLNFENYQNYLNKNILQPKQHRLFER